MRSYSCFYRSIGEKNAVNIANLFVVVVVVMLVVVMMVMLSLPLVMVLVIFGLRKTREGSRRLVYAATAKSPGASSRFSQKMNVGRCNGSYR